MADRFDIGPLNAAERRVLALLAEGHSIKSAAAALGTTPAGASERLRSARRKTGAASSRQLARALAATLHKTCDDKEGMAMGPPFRADPALPADRSPARWKDWPMFLILGIGIALGAAAIELPTDSAPPSVVATSPAPGATVQPGPITLRVTFDRPMRRDSYSFVTLGEGAYPDCAGKPDQSADGKTFTLACTVAPHRRYVVGINGGRFTNFAAAADGRPATPVRLAFATR